MTAHDTFLKLFLDHQTEIRAFVGTLVSDGTRREDVFQEIALTLWKEFDKFDQARSFGAWARGVAANKILQAKRKDRRFPMPFSPEVVEHLLETFASSETSIPSLRERGLRHCRAKLPEKSRLLLDRHYEHGEACASIAKDCKRSVDAVYQTLSRIRRQLGACIETYVKQIENA